MGQAGGEWTETRSFRDGLRCHEGQGEKLGSHRDFLSCALPPGSLACRPTGTGCRLKRSSGSTSKPSRHLLGAVDLIQKATELRSDFWRGIGSGLADTPPQRLVRFLTGEAAPVRDEPKIVRTSPQQTTREIPLRAADTQPPAFLINLSRCDPEHAPPTRRVLSIVCAPIWIYPAVLIDRRHEHRMPAPILRDQHRELWWPIRRSQ